MSTVPGFLESVDLERGVQRHRWGDEHDDRHSGQVWSHILLMQTGKVALAIEGTEQSTDWIDVQERLIKLAATAMAAFDAIERASARPVS